MCCRLCLTHWFNFSFLNCDFCDILRYLGIGLDTVRHMGVARHFALYRLNFEFVRNQRGPVFGRNSTAQLLEKAPIQTTRFRHDFDRLAQFRFDNGPTDVRMVSIRKNNKMTRIGKTFCIGTMRNVTTRKFADTTETLDTSFIRRWVPFLYQWL